MQERLGPDGAPNPRDFTVEELAQQKIENQTDIPLAIRGAQTSLEFTEDQEEKKIWAQVIEFLKKMLPII